MALNAITVERNAMRQCLNEFSINGYIIHEFSFFQTLALDQGFADVASVSELAARDNNAYVV